MEAVQALAAGVYLITVTVVGCRLLLLARRTGELPERLLGLALLLGGTIGGPLDAAGLAAQGELAPAVAGKLTVVGKPFGMAALACHCAFIRRVFRPHAVWARWLAASLVASPVAGFTGALAGGLLATGEPPTVWFCVELVGRVGGSCWLAAEGLRYYGSMKRRLRLGLADKLVTNRFLLWTASGFASIAMMLTAAPPVFLDPIEHEIPLFLDLIAFSTAGIAVSVLYMLTFLPPMAYRRFILGPEAVESA